MADEAAITEALLARAAQGDAGAREELLAQHRRRLRQMIAIHMDQRLGRRLDPSDVVQEVLADAWQKLPAYLQRRPLPFYPWLRQLAADRLLKLQERHVQAQRRSTQREEEVDIHLSDASVVALANCLVAQGTSPSGRLMRKELCRRVRDGLCRLAERDRQLLVMRYLEQLATPEIAVILGISVGAVKTRHVRAVERLREVLDSDLGESQS
jgi:RNA polymerase sigma-70 factor (ECF subfamily)